MALALSFEQTDDGKILKVTDNSSTWDDTLPAIADVTSAKLTIDYNDTSYTINLMYDADNDSDSSNDWENSFGSGTATTDNLVWEVTTDMIDSSWDDVFPDGVYTIT